MAGKAGEAALQEKLDRIRVDYIALVERVRNENVKVTPPPSAPTSPSFHEHLFPLVLFFTLFSLLSLLLPICWSSFSFYVCLPSYPPYSPFLLLCASFFIFQAASDLEKKFLKDEEDFKKQQEAERREFEARLARERDEFKYVLHPTVGQRF